MRRLLIGTLLLAGTNLPRAAADPLQALLAGDGYALRRGAVMNALRERGAGACAILSAYARDRDPTVRENAARAMGDAACAAAGDYQPFFIDGSAWVADALLDAAARNRVAGIVPYAIERLGDERRLVSDDGTRTVAQAAHRVLQMLTAQPIPLRPAFPRQAAGLTGWRTWYAANAGAGSEDWLQTGLEKIRAVLGGRSGPERAEALRVLALVGAPGRTLLNDALNRRPDDLTADVSCPEDEPASTMEGATCLLLIRNESPGPVSLAPGGVAVRMLPAEGKSKADPPSAATRPAAYPDPDELARRLVDLPAGGSLRIPFKTGPAPSDGLYRVQATLEEPVTDPPQGPGKPRTRPPLQALTLVRFES